MQLKVIGSSSSGNSYLLESSSGDVLLIDCGVPYHQILKAVNFKVSSIVGCLLGHEHIDHSKEMFALLSDGIRVISSPGTFKSKGITGHHNTIPIEDGNHIQVGSFQVKAFNVNHDAAQPLGFLIWHHESGLILFATDTYYLDYRFPGLSQIMIEANYSQERLDRAQAFLRNRIMQSHTSIETCIDTLTSTDLSQVINIVLIHLSDTNSNADEFINRVEGMTGKQVFVAEKGLKIPFNKEPF